MRIHQRLTAFFLLLLCTFGMAKSARAHEPQPIWFELKLEEGRLVATLRVLSPLLDQWLKIDRPDYKTITEKDKAEIARKLKLYFSEHPFFRADGIVVDPVVGDMEIVMVETHDLMKLHYIKIAMEYPVLASPKTMNFDWDKWDIFDTWPIFNIGAFLAWDDEEIPFVLESYEPAYVWHARAERRPARVLPPPPEPQPPLELPVLSVAIGAGFLFFLPLSFLLGLGWRVRLGVSGVLLVAALSTLGVAHREFEPPWRDPVQPLSSEEAIEIFEALHHNTYNAFRFEDESTIYDTLARSVEGGLLERLYEEIHESLILREEGGVVSRVTKVEILEEELTLPEDPTRREFEVLATWLVQGRVGHYGHFHVRANRYRAHFLLREQPEGWRILNVEVRDQQRVNLEEDPGLEGGEEE